LSAESILVGKTLKALAEISPAGPVIDLVCASAKDEVPEDPALEELLPETLRVHRIDPVPHGRKTILQRIIGGKGGWQRAAISKALALFPAEHKKPALLYSRSHPPASHLVAMDLINGPLKGVPWVAHFSDPWSQHGYYKSPVTRAALARLEHQVVTTATRLVFVSETLKETVLANQPEEIRAKARVIPHLFEATLYGKAQPPAGLRTGSPTAARGTLIAHVGDLYGMRSPQPLFQGLARLLQARPKPGMLLCQIGRFDPQFEGLDEELGIATLMRYFAPVPYYQSLAIMAAADVLLTIEAPTRNNVFFPSKLVDYLGARKPMFAITPKGSLTSRLMDHWQQPWCDVRDSAGIAAVFQRVDEGKLWPAPDAGLLGEYSAATVGRQLSGVLAELLPHPAPE
jgi:hypothetical protein